MPRVRVRVRCAWRRQAQPRLCSPALTLYRCLCFSHSSRRVEAKIKENDPALASQVHMFSSFFYKKLTTRDRKVNIDPFDTVKKWTSKFDIFEKKYIFIPINEK